MNPDPRMLVVALLRRWPVVHLDVPTGVPKLPVLGIEPQQVAMTLAHPLLLPYARFDISGLENLPEVGAGIVVANHRSYFDPLALGLALSKRGRPVRFLGKKEVFDAPIVGQLAKAFGGIRVERGTGSDEPLAEAAGALEAGELVALMPQGTIPRGPAFFDPVLKGRWGAARLAAMTHAPVYPVGMWGTERVWPRSERAAARVEPDEPAAGDRAGRSTPHHSEAQEPRRRHQADHAGHCRPPATGGEGGTGAHRRGARPHLPARLRGRSEG